MSRFAGRMRHVAVTLSLLFTSCLGFAMEPAEEEFSIKKDYYSTRFDGYYEHYLEREKKEEERLKGADAERKARQRQREEVEKARREYVSTRKAKPAEDTTSWMNEIVARAREQEIYRKDYVKRQKDLEAHIQKYNYIPPEEEFEIDIFYFED